MDHDLLPSEERLALMHKGVVQLHTWLMDIMRTGILEHDFSDEFLSEVAARMVDAKMGALGRRIRQLAHFDKSDRHWTKRLQEQLSLFYLFAINFRNLDQHPLPLQLTLLQWAGFTIKKSALNPKKGINDVWYLVGKKTYVEEQLTVRRIWLIGLQSNRFALQIDFAFGRARFDANYEFGQGYRGRLNYFPSTFPLRAVLFTPDLVILPQIKLPSYDSIDKFMDQYAQAFSRNPWMNIFPCSLAQVKIQHSEDRFMIIDTDLNLMPTVGAEQSLWTLIAVAGGQPITIFGEWNGRELKITSFLENGKMSAL